MFAHVAYVCILSEMYGASGASGTIRRGGSETGLSGEAACSTWEVARWEKHRVSCKEILCVCYLNLINICSCYDMMVMVQPFNSCLKNHHFRSLSCQLFVSRLWTDESAACGLKTSGRRCNTAWLSLSLFSDFTLRSWNRFLCCSSMPAWSFRVTQTCGSNL